jgi:mannose-1-phosphate guanylyltransferase
VLAGGVGARFWPVSTPARPKQLLPLAGDQPLIRQTVDRIMPLVPRERLRILTGERLARPILDAVPELNAAQLMLEPRARGTAPVLAWAAHTIARIDPGAVMTSLHADHVIEPAAAFRAQLGELASAAVAHERLFTIGAVPGRPDTGYGYIRPGEDLGGGAWSVARFEEKPTRAVAERYVAEGYLWNTGIFVWPVGLFLEEIRRHTPEVAACLELLDAGDVAGYFAAVPTVTIDEGLFERSDRVAVMRARFQWDDVGAWDAVGRTRATDAAGNVAVGDAHLVDASGCIAWAEAGGIVLFGTTDLVVVRTEGITFVAPRARTADLKQLIDRLPPGLARPDGGG